MVSLCVASSIPASFNSPSVTFSKPCKQVNKQTKSGRGTSFKKRQWLGYKKKKEKICILNIYCSYLQTIIFIFKYLGVLGQANLSQPPGDGAIIHVWTASWGEDTDYIPAHMQTRTCLHMFLCIRVLEETQIKDQPDYQLTSRKQPARNTSRQSSLPCSSYSMQRLPVYWVPRLTLGVFSLFSF